MNQSWVADNDSVCVADVLLQIINAVIVDNLDFEKIDGFLKIFIHAMMGFVVEESQNVCDRPS